MRKAKADKKPGTAGYIRFATLHERDYVHAGVVAAEKQLQKSAPGARLSLQGFAHSALMDKARAELGGVSFEDWSRKQR